MKVKKWLVWILLLCMGLSVFAGCTVIPFLNGDSSNNEKTEYTLVEFESWLNEVAAENVTRITQKTEVCVVPGVLKNNYATTDKAVIEQLLMRMKTLTLQKASREEASLVGVGVDTLRFTLTDGTEETWSFFRTFCRNGEEYFKFEKFQGLRSFENIEITQSIVVDNSYKYDVYKYDKNGGEPVFVGAFEGLGDFEFVPVDVDDFVPTEMEKYCTHYIETYYCRLYIYGERTFWYEFFDVSTIQACELVGNVTFYDIFGETMQ